VTLNARIIHQYIESTQLLPCESDCRAELLAVGDVENLRQRVAAKLVNGLGEGLGVDVSRNHAGTGLRERDHGGMADTAGSAGHQHTLPSNPLICACFPLPW
jgi:hypothetical protein